MPSSLSDHIAANVLEDKSFNAEYINTNKLRLAENYRFTVSFLKKHGIPYAAGTNAGFFVWVNLRPVFEQSLSEATRAKLSFSDNKEDTQKASTPSQIMDALMEKKIFLASGEAFGSDDPGWFRIVFAHPKDYLGLGLERMLDAVTR